MPFGLRAAVCQPYLADGRGTSRFPNMTLPCVLGVSDHEEPSRASRIAAHKMWSSAGLGRRRRSQGDLFEIPYPARRFPRQRFNFASRLHRITRGRAERYLLPRRGLSPLSVMPVFPAHLGLSPSSNELSPARQWNFWAAMLVCVSVRRRALFSGEMTLSADSILRKEKHT